MGAIPGGKLGNVVSGARVKLLFESKTFAYCTSVSFSEEITQDPVEVLDQLEVAEHVATAYRVTFTAQHVRVLNQSIKKRDGVLIFPQLKSILTAPELTASVEDTTGLVLATLVRVKAQRYTVQIGARGIVLVDCDFVAIKITDESEI